MRSRNARRRPIPRNGRMTDPMRVLAVAMLAALVTVTPAVPSTADQTAEATTAAASSSAEPAAANSAAQDAKPTSGPTAEEILNGTAPPVDYSQAVKCIQSERLERTEPLSERYIVFHLRGEAL